VSADLAAALREAFTAALAALDPAALTAAALAGGDPGSGRVVVVALGKSAATMLAGAARVWGPRIARAVVARPVRARELEPTTRAALAHAVMEEFATGHPLPDEASVRAGTAALQAAADAAAGDLVLVLLSGGASAAASAPRSGLSLEALRAATQALLAAGLPIEMVNAARGRLDRLKHGGLSRAAGRARLLTLAMADVLGPEDEARLAIGSAPTLEVPLVPALLASARTALPASLRAWLDKPASEPPVLATGPRDYRVVASPATARVALEHALARAGFAVHPMADARGDVGPLARRYAATARAAQPGEAWVAVGEPTVVLGPAPGRGGRAGRLALEMAREVDGMARVAFLAGATDGVDGESGHAGAVVTGETMAVARARGVDVDGALARFDDAAAHEALGTSLDPGPTGINLLDLHAVVRGG
jgi:hydroxypyruvate reductase